jgi:hypothetical protein
MRGVFAALIYFTFLRFIFWCVGAAVQGSRKETRQIQGSFPFDFAQGRLLRSG